LNALASTSPAPQTSSKIFSVNNFGNFNVHRQHNSAALSWIFNSADVAGFVIQRSYNGTSFHVIDQVGTSTANWNRYLDNTVEPGTIYYKVVAVMTDGSREESPVTSVRIVRHR
jgi:hypothetical protein